MRQHTAGQTERFQSRLMIKGMTLTIGCLYIAFIVRTVTTRTFPSCPGWTSTMRARGHFVGAIGSSRNHTMSPTQTLCDGTGHIDSFCKLVRYSVDQRCQKCRTRARHKRQRRNKDTEVAGDSDHFRQGGPILVRADRFWPRTKFDVTVRILRDSTQDCKKRGHSLIVSTRS